MTTYFLDTSALVKRYVVEVGSAWVSALSDPAAGHVCRIAAITQVELLAALYRRVRSGSLPLVPLRAYDALQLATALYLYSLSQPLGLPAPTFLSADQTLNHAALSQGLPCDDPNTHP